MQHFLNSMTFLVKVPVLSEKRYLTCPSSSLRSLVRGQAPCLGTVPPVAEFECTLDCSLRVWDPLWLCCCCKKEQFVSATLPEMIHPSAFAVALLLDFKGTRAAATRRSPAAAAAAAAAAAVAGGCGGIWGSPSPGRKMVLFLVVSSSSDIISLSFNIKKAWRALTIPI